VPCSPAGAAPSNLTTNRVGSIRKDERRCSWPWGATAEMRHRRPGPSSHTIMRKPLACPCCGATRGISIESNYTLADGHRRRLRRCSHCGSVVRTIQPPGELERLAQDVITQATAPKPQKLTEADVLAIRNAAARAVSHRELAKTYGVTRQTIQQIASGATWRLVGGPINRRFCSSCEHYGAGCCAFGFPEAVEEPWFASECSLYEVSQSISRD